LKGGDFEMRDLETTIKDELTAMLEDGLGLDDVDEMTSFLVVAIKTEMQVIEVKQWSSSSRKSA